MKPCVSSSGCEPRPVSRMKFCNYQIAHMQILRARKEHVPAMS